MSRDRVRTRPVRPTRRHRQSWACHDDWDPSVVRARPTGDHKQRLVRL